LWTRPEILNARRIIRQGAVHPGRGTARGCPMRPCRLRCRRPVHGKFKKAQRFRRDGRVVEGARLESVFRGNSNVGSNPTLSAIDYISAL